MAVTTQAYNLSVNWTATQFFDALEDAFIDAGIITTAAYDRFVDGAYTHMVVEVVYDAAKAYGKRYYRFMFNSGTLWYSISNGWNATTHQPTGTLYVDYPSNSGNQSSNGFWQYASFSTTTSVVIKRFTSGVSTNFSAFRIQNGTNFCCFFLVPATASRQPWLDLAKTSFGMMHHPNIYTSGYSYISFPFNICVRRDAHSGPALRGDTMYFEAWWHSHYNYAVWGKQNQTYGGNWAYTNSNFPHAVNSIPANVIPLPIDDPANNPAYATLKAPVFAGVPYNAYLQDALPTDFGISGVYNNTMGIGDQLVVQAGIEEWEILARKNNQNSDGTVYPSGAFVARVV